MHGAAIRIDLQSESGQHHADKQWGEFDGDRKHQRIYAGGYLLLDGNGHVRKCAA
jgi:hypothetical protein